MNTTDNSKVYSPVIAMLHNTKLNRWHPIYFLESPLPGPFSAENPTRHKSKGHHTEGYPTREEAVASLLGLQTSLEISVGTPEMCLGCDIPWDGEGIPAISCMFVKTGNGVQMI